MVLIDLGDAPCLTTYDACCQWYDVSEASLFLKSEI